MDWHENGQELEERINVKFYFGLHDSYTSHKHRVTDQYHNMAVSAHHKITQKYSVYEQ